MLSFQDASVLIITDLNGNKYIKTIVTKKSAFFLVVHVETFG